MVIDVHYHLLVEDWLPEAWWKLLAEIYATALRGMGMETTPEEVKRNILDTFWDPDGEKLLREMEEAGIDKTVLLPQDLGLALGEQPISIEARTGPTPTCSANIRTASSPSLGSTPEDQGRRN